MTAPSVAQGLAAMSVVGALTVGFGAWGVTHASEPRRAVCQAPVEVLHRGAVDATLGCANALAECVGARGGDRVVVTDGECAVEPGGMRPTWRLDLGLGLDVNGASVQELQLIRGIGPSLAAAIVGYRDRHGAFSTWDSLLGVPGIGPRRLARFRGSLTIADDPSP